MNVVRAVNDRHMFIVVRCKVRLACFGYKLLNKPFVATGASTDAITGRLITSELRLELPKRNVKLLILLRHYFMGNVHRTS